MNDLRYLISADDKASATFRRIRSEIDAAGKSFAVLGRIIGPIAPQLAGAFTVAAVGAWANRVIEGVDALNDLKDATGDSIENLSALEDIAARTGTSMETAGDAVIRLNKSLGDAAKDPDSAAGRAIKGLGLDIKELLALSPVERLQAVGKAINSFDDVGKLEYNLALLGKSTKAQSALLKDLAEAGKLQAKVTDEQAQEAEKLRKELAALEKDAVDLSRALAGPLVSSINETIGIFRAARKEGKGFFETLGAQQLELLGLGGEAGLENLRRQLTGVEGALANVQLPPQMRIEYQQRRLDLARQIGAAEQKATAAFRRGDKDTAPVGLPKLPALGSDKADADAKRAAEARRRLAEDAAKAVVEIEEQAARDTAEAWGYWERSQLAAYEERAEAAKKQWQQVFEFIDAEQERAIAEGQAYIDALAAVEKTGQKVGEELALVFSSAAGQALTNWEGVGSLLRGILIDLAQIGTREIFTKPLSGLLTGALQGFSFASLFGGGRASGGPVQAGRIYEVNEGGVGELLSVGSRQYLLAGRSGNIAPGGGGGGGITINYGSIVIGAGVSRNEVMAAMQITEQRTVAAIADARRRGHPMAALA